MDVQKFNKCLKKAHRDKKSLEFLYDFYYKRIVFHLYKDFGRELAEDVAQEFFIKLINHDKQYEYINNPTAWVYACCKNIARTKIAKENRDILLDEELCVSKDLSSDFDKLFLGTVLEELDDVTKKIVVLHYWEGYGFGEISEILGIGHEAIRQRHKRVKAKLKNILI